MIILRDKTVASTELSSSTSFGTIPGAIPLLRLRLWLLLVGFLRCVRWKELPLPSSGLARKLGKSCCFEDKYLPTDSCNFCVIPVKQFSIIRIIRYKSNSSTNDCGFQETVFGKRTNRPS